MLWLKVIAHKVLCASFAHSLDRGHPDLGSAWYVREKTVHCAGVATYRCSVSGFEHFLFISKAYRLFSTGLAQYLELEVIHVNLTTRFSVIDN